MQTETFTTSYKGMGVDANIFEERQGVLLDNTSETLIKFTQEAVSGFIFKKNDGTTGYKGVFPKQQ